MYSKLFRLATLAAAVLCTVSCRVKAPWSGERVGQEVNLVMVVENNLLYIPSAQIDGHAGRFLIGASQPTSVLDPHFSQTLGGGSRHSLKLNERESLPLSGVVADLRGIGDAIIGADVWGTHAVTIDFRAGLVTLQREGIHSDYMTIFRYTDQPMITIAIDGRSIPAVIDTTSPDTVVLPSSTNGRRSARLQVAGTDFGQIDIRSGGVESARVGNRVLSKFLVSIDYGRRVVGLWRDPRIAL